VNPDPEPRTHRAISWRLVGRALAIDAGRSATVELELTEEMAADERGLVHGGFVFGLADYAAMVAVDEPNVVLAAAEVRFTAPAVVGDRLRAEAAVENDDPRRPRVLVTVWRDEAAIFEGRFTCVVPRRHVLDRRAEEGN
jgi:acyl-coenzyme A thioesterase PaaI-like protein